MKVNDRGFTLIELIVVITIIAVFAAYGLSSIAPSNSAKARQCASQTDNLIAKCRIGCLSRAGDVYLILRTNASGKIIGDYYEDGSDPLTSDIISDSSVSMSYIIKYTDERTEEINLEGNPLTLSFNRSTGGLNPQSDGSYCNAINISCGSKSYTIDLVPSTGTHTIR